MSTVHLEHALLDIGNLERTLAFYRRLFPAWIIRWDGRTSEGTRWVHFGPPGDGQPGYLSLYETPGLAPSDGSGARIEHIGFAHPDVNGLVERLGSEGTTPSDRVDDGHYRRAYFTDPDGHELEFVQRLSG